jgi:hypothetical protein
MHAGVLNILRTGDWLTYERVRRIAVALICAYVAAVGYLVVTANGPVDALGRAAGDGFLQCVRGRHLCARRQGTGTVRPALQYAREQAIFGPDTPVLRLALSAVLLVRGGRLALLPYGLALAVWQIATFLLYLVRSAPFLQLPDRQRHERRQSHSPRSGLTDGRRLSRRLRQSQHGHNGFLSAALMAPRSSRLIAARS